MAHSGPLSIAIAALGPTVPAWLRRPVAITALMPPHRWSDSINKGAVFLMIATCSSILRRASRRFRR